MPSVANLRVRPGGTGAVGFSNQTASSVSGLGGPSKAPQVNFAVQSATGEGIGLYDSATVSGSNITLTLRTLVPGSNITLTRQGGLIVIGSTVTSGAPGPTGPTGASGGGGSGGSDPFVQIGLAADANNSEGYAIAIGTESQAADPLGVAVGRRAQAAGSQSIGVGYIAYALGTRSIAIGGGSAGNAYGTIAIGWHTVAASSKTVAIGLDAHDSGVSSDNSVIIGANAYSQGGGNIVIGYSAYAGNVQRSIVLGTHAIAQGSTSVVIGGNGEATTYGGVAIGQYASSLAPQAISVGYLAVSAGPRSLALGQGSRATNQFSTALGSESRVVAPKAVAVGYGSYSGYQGSTVFSGCADITSNSFVFGGAIYSGVRPTKHQQFLIGYTTANRKATAAWGNGSYLATVSAPTAGTSGNSYFFDLVTGGSPDQSTASVLQGNTIVTVLGTDSGGAVDPTKNTLAQIKATFPASGFTFDYTAGYGATPISFNFNTAFANGFDGTTSATLTTDGAAPSGTTHNVPAIFGESLATVTGRVIGAGQNIYTGGGDAATFVLAPLMLVHNNDGGYNLIGTPTFTLENNTAGAIDWPVPTLTIDGDNNLSLVVTNDIDPAIKWIAYLDFLANQ